jgi:hypothetical protein
MLSKIYNYTTGKDIILAGAGFWLICTHELNSRVDAFIMQGSPIHDFIGLVLVFLNTSYLVLLPEWDIMFIMGTLIVYYTVIKSTWRQEVR